MPTKIPVAVQLPKAVGRLSWLLALAGLACTILQSAAVEPLSNTDPATSGGVSNQPGGGASNPSGAPAGGGNAPASNSSQGQVNLQAGQLSDDVIDIVSFAGGGGGGDGDEYFCSSSPPESGPMWKITMDSYPVTPSGEAPPADRLWDPLGNVCACGLSGGDVSFSLAIPNGETISLPNVRTFDNGCVLAGKPDIVPYPGTYQLELRVSGGETLPYDFSLSPTNIVSMGSIMENGAKIFWFAGFSPGEQVRVVYWLMQAARTDIPANLTRDDLRPEVGVSVARFVLAADATTQADNSGYVIVNTDLSAGDSGIVGASGSSGEAYAIDCKVAGCNAVSDHGHLDVEADAVFGRVAGTLEDLYGTDAAASTCEGALPPRMTIGGRGRVVFGEGRSSLWSEPNALPEVAKVDEGTEFTVIGGPVCTPAQSGSLNSWQVRLDNGLEGWLTEGYAGGAYWIEPLP